MTPLERDPHNLFAHATSELSQDAWICWLLAHVGHAARPELRDAAHDFVARFWNATRPDDAVLATEVEGPAHVERQWNHVDVLARLRVRERPTVLLIEDKTTSTQHGGQLERYRALVEREWAGAEIVPVYLKTGYHFESDIAAREAGFAVLGLEEVVAFLNAHAQRVASDIFADYAAHQRRVLEHRRYVLGALDGAEGHAELGHGFAQHALLVRLRDAAVLDGDRRGINRGHNPDGTPWTHWQFGMAAAPLTLAVHEVFFHRIDARNDPSGARRYYLSTRQYAEVRKRGDELRREKVRRLREHRRLFELAAADIDLELAKPSADHKGANESEIGVLFFDGQRNSTANVLRLFPLLHRAFVGRLREAGLLAPLRPA